jgi:cobyrinic acid a,c-diamide synthase
LVIGGVSSGAGKTTLAVALTRALRGRGLRVAVFKCGPDYLDPTYLRRAAGSPCHNLDGWMMGRDAVLDTFSRASAGADFAVIEGVMGLFDGASPTGEAGSTAEIAKWLRAPVALVADAGGMARSVAALTQGFAAFDPDLRVAGLICNRVGSRGHLDLLRQAMRQVPVLGGLPRADGLEFPERHLGLRTADEAIPEEHFEGLARLAEQWLDLDAIVALARSAPELPATSAAAPQPAPPVSRPVRCRIGVAMDEAFHFYYEDNLARLRSLGAELVPFSPIRDALPAVDGLYLGGGYPELFARELSANAPLLEQLRAFAASGRPVYAECGGLMLLGRALHTVSGERFTMAGVLPLETQVRDRLQALGYVEVETQAPSILGAAGLRFRGHQFRYSEATVPEGGIGHVYSLRVRRGGETRPEGYGSGSVLASYVHAHWASNPRVAEGFVSACAAAAGREPPALPAADTTGPAAGARP